MNKLRPCGACHGASLEKNGLIGNRGDRDGYKAHWQRQLNELGAKVPQISQQTQEADRRLEARIAHLAEESRAADKRLEAHRGARLRLGRFPL